jgi:hypothetical protein
MKDHLKYRYLFVADGWGAAWRRVPLILSSNSLMVKPYSDNIQWFYDLVKPNEHYLPLKNDLSDLLPKLKLM